MSDQDRVGFTVRYIVIVLLIVLNSYWTQTDINRNTNKVLESIEKIESRLEILEPSSIMEKKNVLPETR